MTQLVKYDTMCRAIAEAHEVDEVKDIRDKAMALEHYARQAKNVDAERRACEIRLRAERRAGEMLAMTEKAKGAMGNPGGRGAKVVPSDETRTLSDLGISYDQSSQWQKLAKVPDTEFEAMLGGDEKPTTTGILRKTAEPKTNPVSSDALWVWGRLRDFEQRGLLDEEPSDVLSTMTSEMLSDVKSLAPRVSVWLTKVR